MNDKLSENTWKDWQVYRLKVDEMTKLKIRALSERALRLFHAYREACKEIEQLLAKHLKKETLDGMCQPSDGMVAVVDNGFLASSNIPIEQFLEG